MVSRETSGAPQAPPSLPQWLEPVRPGLVRYAEILAGPGTERGLMGPREADRLWDRHLLNCAVVADPEVDLVPSKAQVADIGSGAGLPGLVWALVRPDISVVLIESLLRRATFLTECVQELVLGDRVQVVRTRAEDVQDRSVGMDVVTARAVAPLATLAGWGVPLLKPGGKLVALKGESAPEEVDRDSQVLGELGLVDVQVRLVGHRDVQPATTVVVATRATAE